MWKSGLTRDALNGAFRAPLVTGLALDRRRRQGRRPHGPSVSLFSRYPEAMTSTAPTSESLALRELIEARRDEFRALLAKYAATNPMLFGSVSRGTANGGSDVDILVDMDPADGNLLMRASGLLEEVRTLFGREDIDIFPEQLLKRPIADVALRQASAL